MDDSINSYAVENESSPFDDILPDKPHQVSTQPTRIPYLTRAGTTKVVVLKKPNKYHQILFKAFSTGFQSDWFTGLADRSKTTYFDSCRQLFDWINASGYKTTDKTRYNTLKDYEAYLLNDRGTKYSHLALINQLLREGLPCPSLTDANYDYLQTLLSLSKPAKYPEPEPVTLSSWFNLPWLRVAIGEQAYLQLESPRLLLSSFRVTIATTLLYLLEQRQYWQRLSTVEFDASGTGWQYDWNPELLERGGKFNKQGEPEDEFTQLLWLDIVKPTAQENLKEKLMQADSYKFEKRLSYKNNKIYPWQKPVFFHPDYQSQYSPVEELLCAWLVACEAVQPTDILKLKTSNYARERNRSGRLIAMQCTYYKGRAGNFKHPAILMASDPWTRAMDRYMTGLPGSSLFKTAVAKNIKFPSLSTNHNLLFFLIKIWKLPSFQHQLESELSRTDATSLFLRAMLAQEQGGESFNSFNMRAGTIAGEYEALVSRPLPHSVFTFTHIKNTAVHAGTDTYREADLVNHHSHTALTEKTSYLTDQNKEWVNQAGRITRLVLHDLQNVVYQPSIEAIRQTVDDLELRTRIIKATHTNDIVTHSLKSSSIEGMSDSTIIVSDTADTALYFIHYIYQAETLLPKLLAARPDWVERTLIVQVEWMTRALIRMRTAATAQKTYKNLAAHLPPLFDHLLETTE